MFKRFFSKDTNIPTLRLTGVIGQAGIEEKFDSNLRGDDGYQFMEVDARGRMKRVIRSNNIFKGIENKEATPGHNVRLTIDRDMQLTAYKALEGKVGSVVAVDVQTGEILLTTNVTKTIASHSSGGDVFRFLDLGTKALELETGVAVNEPVNYAIRTAIEFAVLQLIQSGEKQGFWKYKEKEIEIPVPHGNIRG